MPNYKIKYMRIAQVAPLWFRVPPKTYGGTELVVYNLTEELVKRGHQVTLFASGNSKTSAKLVSGWPRNLIAERLYGHPIPWGNCIFPLLNISNAFEMANKFDIIHIHEPSRCLSNYFTRLIKTPTIITIHDPFPNLKAKDKIALFKKYKNNNYVAISKFHRQSMKLKIHFVGTVYNGINIKLFKFKKNLVII